MKRAEEISNEFGIVSHILEPPDRFKFAREMIRHFVDRRLNLERAVPCTSTLIVEPIAARPRVRERSIDERIASATEDEFSWI